MKFDIWIEGFSATGEYAPATFEGKYVGANFAEACEAWASEKPERLALFQVKDTPAYWGCRMFDNEKDARKLFG